MGTGPTLQGSALPGRLIHSPSFLHLGITSLPRWLLPQLLSPVAPRLVQLPLPLRDKKNSLAFITGIPLVIPCEKRVFLLSEFENHQSSLIILILGPREVPGNSR